MDLLCYYGLSNNNIKINYCDKLIVLKCLFYNPARTRWNA